MPLILSVTKIWLALYIVGYLNKKPVHELMESGLYFGSIWLKIGITQQNLIKVSHIKLKSFGQAYYTTIQSYRRSNLMSHKALLLVRKECLTM